MPDYVSRLESRQVDCPYCGAVAGERCLGVRGKRREASHLERVNTARERRNIAPQRVELSLGEGGAELTTPDGTVIGRIESIEVGLYPDLIRETVGEPTERGAKSAVAVDVPDVSPTSVVSLSQEGLGTNDQSSLLPDPVNETWDLYKTALGRPKAQLLPKVRKWIRDAHQAVGVELTQQAIRGLAASHYHRDHGYVGIEYAITPKRGETIEGRIEQMAARAPATNGLTPVAQFAEHIAPIEAALTETASTKAMDIARQHVAQLREQGYEPVVESGRVIGLRAIA